MELKPRLEEYEEHSFLGLVEAIWQANADKPSHDAWIAHFNNIVGHPAGSDLLFYSNADETGSVNSPAYIVETVTAWHRQNGRAAFLGQTLQPLPPRQSLTREQRASQSSNLNLEKVRKLVAEVHSAEQQSAQQLAVLEQQLATDPIADTPEQQLAVSLATLRALETTQHQAKRAVNQLERLQMSLKFARDGAARDATSSFLNASIQAGDQRWQPAACGSAGGGTGAPSRLVRPSGDADRNPRGAYRPTGQNHADRARPWAADVAGACTCSRPASGIADGAGPEPRSGPTAASPDQKYPLCNS